MLFPLCRALGLVHGATPALVERVARYQAKGGATQQRTLQRLHQEHGTAWGVKRLRPVTAFVAAALEGHRAEAHAEQVRRWLEQAQAGRGRHRPVLGVGRDGITLCLTIKGGSIYEVATTGTLTVYDRRGRWLGTVYLASTPEPGQPAMSAADVAAGGGVALVGGPVAAAVLRHGRRGQRDALLPPGAQAAAAPADGRAAGMVLSGGLIPRLGAAVGAGGDAVRAGTAVVGAEDAEAAGRTGHQSSRSKDMIR